MKPKRCEEFDELVDNIKSNLDELCDFAKQRREVAKANLWRLAMQAGGQKSKQLETARAEFKKARLVHTKARIALAEFSQVSDSIKSLL